MKSKTDVRMKYMVNVKKFLEERRPSQDSKVGYALFSAHDLALYLGADLGTTKWCLMACNREGLVSRGRRPKIQSQFDQVRTLYAVPAQSKTLRDIPLNDVDYMR